MIRVFLLRQWVLSLPAEVVLDGTRARMLWGSSERVSWGDKNPLSDSEPMSPPAPFPAPDDTVGFSCAPIVFIFTVLWERSVQVEISHL